MGRIRIDMSALKAFSGSLNSKLSEFEALSAQIDALNDSIGSSWSGLSKDAYLEMAGGLKSKQELLKGIISTFKSYADDTSDKFTELDAKCASIIRNSF